MSAAWAPVLPIALPLLAAALAMVGPGRRALMVVGSLAQLGAAAWLLIVVLQNGVVVTEAGNWPAPFGIVLAADMLGALLVFVTGLVGTCVALFALSDIEPETQRAGFASLYLALLAGVAGAFLTGDVFNLYVWFEIILIAAFGLLALGGQRPQLDATIKYAAVNLVGTTLFLIATGLLYGSTGTLNFADLYGKTALVDPGLLQVIGLIYLVALALKAAAFPLFFWLPAAYHTPLVSTSAIFAGLVTKVGAYAVMRIVSLVFSGDALLETLLLWLAGATMLFGMAGALVQTDVRRILSFNLIAGIGFILMGIGIGGAAGLAGAVFYTGHHIVVMAALFMIAGVMAQRGGGFDVRRLAGFYQQAPALAALFLLAALALIGIPPFSGFWAKVMLVRAGLDAGLNVMVAVALVTGLLTMVSMGRIWAVAFLRPAEGPTAEHPVPTVRPWPPWVLVAVAILVGVLAEPVVAIATAAGAGLDDPASYIDAVLGGRS